LGKGQPDMFSRLRGKKGMWEYDPGGAIERDSNRMLDTGVGNRGEKKKIEKR